MPAPISQAQKRRRDNSDERPADNPRPSKAPRTPTLPASGRQPGARLPKDFKPPRWADKEEWDGELKEFHAKAAEVVHNRKVLLSQKPRLMAEGRHIIDRATYRVLSARTTFYNLIESRDAPEGQDQEYRRKAVANARACSQHRREVLDKSVNNYLQLEAEIEHMCNRASSAVPSKTFSTPVDETRENLAEAFEQCGAPLPDILKAVQPGSAA